MHKVCSSECKGLLQKFAEDSEKIVYKCTACGKEISQRKRKPNDEIRKVELYKAEWELIAIAVDKLATSTIMEDLELFNKAIAVKNKIIEACKPRPYKLKITDKRKQLHEAFADNMNKAYWEQGKWIERALKKK